MIPDNVTLIVKAPNQQIEDQNIECQSSWTVKQLKGHLSDVYPNKPRTDEQKIIYSGQLLDDSIVLKDVLRTYDSQIVHTMHLVCAPKRTMPEHTQTAESADGLRRRNVADAETERPAEVSRPETRQNDQNHTVEMQNYLSSLYVNNYGRVPPYPNYNMGEAYLPVPNDPAMLANHMMMMQQAYLQYMQQYANMWQGAVGVPPGAAPPAAETPPPPAPAEPPAPADDEEAREHRDWLDHLYAASRLAILFSLVYLYGSPARFLLVLLLATAGYLHQIGFFRDLQVNPAPENPHQAPPAANVAANAAQQNNEVNNAANNGVNNVVNNAADNAANNIANNDATNANVNMTHQSLLAVTWMIVTSFFASLIPDTN